MSLVKVYTDVGLAKPVTLPAKICKRSKKTFHIKYLSPTEIRYNGKKVYNYENILYEIDESSISEFLNTDDEKDIGYIHVDEGFVKMSDIDDDDYQPSSSDESESESLVDEEEDDEDEDEGDDEDDYEDDDDEE